MDEIDLIINDLVDLKVNQLKWFDLIRWEGGRLYYETKKMEQDYIDLENDVQALFLERLKQRIIEEDFHIYDWTLSGQVDITVKILAWIDKRLIIWKLKNKSVNLSNYANTMTFSNTQGENKFPEIFKIGGYELFVYLNKNYSRHNKSLPTKYSNLYHFMKLEQYLVCTQKMYIGFVKSEFKACMSKILPQTFEYKDTFQSILGQLRSNFDKSQSK